MTFGSDGPADQIGGAASASEGRQQQMPVSFSGGRKPTPRSVRTVSMHDSKAASATGPGGGSGARQDPATGRTTTTRVSSSAGATPPPTSSFPSSSFFCSRAWSRNAKASALGMSR